MNRPAGGRSGLSFAASGPAVGGAGDARLAAALTQCPDDGEPGGLIGMGPDRDLMGRPHAALTALARRVQLANADAGGGYIDQGAPLSLGPSLKVHGRSMASLSLNDKEMCEGDHDGGIALTLTPRSIRPE